MPKFDITSKSSLVDALGKENRQKNLFLMAVPLRPYPPPPLKINGSRFN